MVFMSEAVYLGVLITHIVFTVAAVGVVSVTDYLHLAGLRNKVREKKLLFVYPLLGKAIIFFVALILITGTLLVINKPELLSSSLFRLKIALFGVVLINGVILHKYVAKGLDKCILKGGFKNCSRELLLVSALSGSISLSSWYGILIISLTKQIGYSAVNFFIIYLAVIAFLFLFAIRLETNARQWEDIV